MHFQINYTIRRMSYSVIYTLIYLFSGVLFLYNVSISVFHSELYPFSRSSNQIHNYKDALQCQFIHLFSGVLFLHNV